MVFCTGGMSVDADDLTPAAIKEIGGQLVTYGTPVLPGAMFLMAYYGEIPVMGLPGCIMHAKTTVFDMVLPKILAGKKLQWNILQDLDMAVYVSSVKCAAILYAISERGD